jgi:hypothetical protein
MWREDLAAEVVPAAKPAPATRRRKLTWGIIAAAVAASLGAGATVAAASTAEPGSPLWPITQRVFPEKASHASAKAARAAIADARAAVNERRLDDAQRSLKQAEGLIATVQSGLEREALNAELAQVRALLASALNGQPLPVPSPATTPAPTVAPSPGGGPAPSPSPSKPGGDLLPLPTITLPLPSLPLL